MADLSANPFPSPSSKKSPTSFLLGLSAFASKAFSDADPAMSPTSVLDSEPFSVPKSPVWCKPGSGVGLGILDSLTDNAEPGPMKKLIVVKKPENSKFSLFGSQLKIQIPSPHKTFSVDSQKSPMEFGIKTRNSQPGLDVSPKSSSGSVLNFCGSISNAEMELSEDYTCVISRGGHVTKMTRIFDDCIVDSCFGDSFSTENGVPVTPDGLVGYEFQNFFSFCHTCKKKLGQGEDIFMYRGEKAFCAVECRQRGMMVEEPGALGVQEIG